MERKFRVVLLHWKDRNEVEVYSNLKVLSQRHPQFNYNTLNNYLSKSKVPFETENVLIERKPIITQHNMEKTIPGRKMIAVVNQQPLKSFDEKEADLQYWLRQPPAARIAAVTSLIQSAKKKGERMDKTALKKYYRQPK